MLDPPSKLMHWHARMFCIFFVAAIGITLMPKMLNGGDPLTWRGEASNLVLTGDLHVPAQLAASYGQRGQFFVVNTKTGLYYSKYGVMNTWISALPMLVELAVTGKLPVFGSEAFLDFMYVGISLVITLLLYQIAMFYSQNALSCMCFVLFSIYATFLWHHLRSGGQESTQLMFTLAAFLALLHFEHNGQSRLSLMSVTLSLSALVLTKIFFVCLIPPFAAACIIVKRRRSPTHTHNRYKSFLKVGSVFLLPLIVGLAMNWIKFGDPLKTGYEQWHTFEVAPTGSYVECIYELIVSQQWGLFTAFPMLLVALPYCRLYFRKYTLDAVLVLSILFVLLVLIGRLPIWRGELCYGPRYFVFILPLLGLPSVRFFDKVFSFKVQSAMVRTCQFALLILLCISMFFQYQVERVRPFFAYEVRPPSCAVDPNINGYFANTHFGIISFELLKHKKNVDLLWFMPTVREQCGQVSYNQYAQRLTSLMSESNFYWFE